MTTKISMFDRSHKLNVKEQAVFDAFPSPSYTDKPEDRHMTDLASLAGDAFGSQKRGTAPKSKGNSWVRNSMRKLTRLALVKRVAGTKGRTSKYVRTKLTPAAVWKEACEKRDAVEAKKAAKLKKSEEVLVASVVSESHFAMEGSGNLLITCSRAALISRMACREQVLVPFSVFTEQTFAQFLMGKGWFLTMAVPHDAEPGPIEMNFATLCPGCAKHVVPPEMLERARAEQLKMKGDA